jgi:hypothetical protein
MMMMVMGTYVGPQVLIDERDEWLAQQLYSCARNDVIERIDESEPAAPTHACCGQASICCRRTHTALN